MFDDSETVGQRVRRARLRLGLTQADLAADLRRTQGWVSRVEKGDIELNRTSVLNEVAGALHVHPNELVARPYTGRAGAHQWRAAAAAVLRELRRHDLPPAFPGRPRSATELWQVTAVLHRLRDDADNVGILQRLPDLLREALALAEVSAGREREEAFAVYAVAVKFGHTAGHSLGHPELVAMACERAAWAAQRSGDPLLPVIADWMRVWDMWATADWSDAVTLSDQALRAVEPSANGGDPFALRLWGSLHLRAAVSAARGGRGQEAWQRIEEAGEAARRAARARPTFDRHSLTFSAGNVAIHGVNVALELGQHVEALRLHETMDVTALGALPRSRRGYYQLDLARAYLWSGRRDRALTALAGAERTAPQLVRNHPLARATLRRIMSGERGSLREELRRMSDRFHLDG